MEGDLTSSTGCCKAKVPPFHHPSYTLDADGDKVIPLHKDRPPPTEDVQRSLVDSLSTYVRAYIQARWRLLSHWIPCEEVPAKCDILLTPDWDVCDTLLVIMQNHVGSQLGMWSRSLCLSHGLRRGSMVSFLEAARDEAGFGVIICNANLNSVTVKTEDGKTVKMPITDSSFPEEHTMYVYENFVSQTQAKRVLLFGYGNGAILCKEMIQRQIAMCEQPHEEEEDEEGQQQQQQDGENRSACPQLPPPSACASRIVAMATVEASAVILEDDSADVKAFMARLAVNWEASEHVPLGATIARTRAKLGVSQVLSVGQPPNVESHSTAWSLSVAQEAVFRYFFSVLNDDDSTHRHGSTSDDDLGYRFACAEAARFHAPAPSIPSDEDEEHHLHAHHHNHEHGHRRFPSSLTSILAAEEASSPLTPPRPTTGLLTRLLQRKLSASGDGGSSTNTQGSTPPLLPPPPPPSDKPPQHQQQGGGAEGEEAVAVVGSGGGGGGVGKVAMDQRIGIRDFDLLKVVGKGAFGKVMLVRKKTGTHAGSVYAMKVLKKANVMNKGQMEHTLSERAILCAIRHPFIVRLRFAFQNSHSLYLVTDYYSGGSLFSHLRRCGSFSEARARFYAAELLLALKHLHDSFIVYRDLKLENVLMDAQGHVALTDFGLSKQGVHSAEGARTFCGTAEYIAPELLKGNAYGSAVDWWSYGVLVYEMMAGVTPFYHKNRKYMFHCIVHNVRPSFPITFSFAADRLVDGLLDTDPLTRLGSSSCGKGGAKQIMEHEFFRGVDWGKLMRKQVEPPFNPRVKGDTDTKFLPSNVHKMQAKDSVAAEPKEKGMTTTSKARQLATGDVRQQDFDQFAYFDGGDR